MITLNLRGSYSEAAFCAEVTLALSLAPIVTLGDAFNALAKAGGEEIQLIWHDFHSAQVGPLGAQGLAAELRAAAHSNQQLRLVFYDEERGGQ